MTTTATDGPHLIDLIVGANIRKRRKTMGVTQEQLADELGLTFQQVQKYERGANRVSASKLYEISQALACPPSHFYEGAEGVPEEASQSAAQAAVQLLLGSTTMVALATALNDAPALAQRAAIEAAHAVLAAVQAAISPEAPAQVAKLPEVAAHG